MIEFLVTVQGLMIFNGMHAQTLTPATRPVTVLAGRAHPATFVTASAGFGFFDSGDYPPSDPTDAWFQEVFGMSTGSLLTRRRVNVVDQGSGIKVQISGTIVELEIRSRDGTRVERRRWAGPGDFDVNGAVQQADMDSFLNAFHGGNASADFNQDGRITESDRTAFTAAWDGGGPVPCAADLTLDGAVDTADLLDYLNLWFPGLLEADLAEPTGAVDIRDLLEYLDRWFQGC